MPKQTDSPVNRSSTPEGAFGSGEQLTGAEMGRVLSDTGSLERELASTTRWIKVLQCGLNGAPQVLGMGQGDAMERCLRRLGIRLLSQTAASKKGLHLRRGAKPVVSRYYGAPIAAYHPLFCLEQFRAAKVKAAMQSPENQQEPDQATQACQSDLGGE